LCTCVASGCRVSDAWSPCSVLAVACSAGSRVGGGCCRRRSRSIAAGGCCVGSCGRPVASLPSLALDPSAATCRCGFASRRCCSAPLSLACGRSPGPTIAAAPPCRRTVVVDSSGRSCESCSSRLAVPPLRGVRWRVAARSQRVSCQHQPCIAASNPVGGGRHHPISRARGFAA
jgi:hypothetical protein